MTVKRAVDMDLVRKGVHDTPAGDYKIDLTGSGTKTHLRCVAIGSRGEDVVLSGPTSTTTRGTARPAPRPRRLTLTVDGKVVGSKRVQIGRISNDAPLTVGGKPERIGDYDKGLIDEVSLSIG